METPIQCVIFTLTFKNQIIKLSQSAFFLTCSCYICRLNFQLNDTWFLKARAVVLSY